MYSDKNKSVAVCTAPAPSSDFFLSDNKSKERRRALKLEMELQESKNYIDILEPDVPKMPAPFSECEVKAFENGWQKCKKRVEQMDKEVAGMTCETWNTILDD